MNKTNNEIDKIKSEKRFNSKKFNKIFNDTINDQDKKNLMIKIKEIDRLNYKNSKINHYNTYNDFINKFFNIFIDIITFNYSIIYDSNKEILIYIWIIIICITFYLILDDNI